MTRLRGIAALSAVLGLAGCAATRGYLGLRPMAHGPYYHTWTPLAVPDTAVVTHLPITFDVMGTALPEGGARLLEPLLTAMNGYLDAAGWSTALPSAPSPWREAPWAYVGTRWSLSQVEMARTRMALDANPTGSDLSPETDNVIQARQGSDRWRQDLAGIAAARHADFVLLITLGAADYYPRSRSGLTLRKAVDLGTGNDVSVSWLTSSTEPIQVVHLMGVLLDATGRVLRAGAEGIIMKEPNVLNVEFWVVNGHPSLQHVPTQLSQEDLASVLASRHRDELPGQPIAWQEALRNLVRQLLGRPTTARAP